MVKIHVAFSQRDGAIVSKDVEFAHMPQVGALVEYEEDWSPVGLVPHDERGVHLWIGKADLEISGYGPEFSQEERDSLAALGWEVRGPRG